VSEAGGRRVIVTRPAVQAAAVVRQLQARGVDAVALPLIEIAGAGDTAPLAAAWASLASRRLVVFVSVNAVLHFFAARPAAAVWPDSLLAAAPGPGTAAALRTAGVDPAAVIEPAEDAAQLDSEALWQRLAGRDWRGASVLVVRGDGGRDWLAAQLAGAGAVVDAVTGYVRRSPAFDAAARRIVDAATAAPDAHAWLFSSSEAIGHLEANAGAGRWNGSAAIATHPRIAARAREAGFAPVREARPDLDDVVACIQSMRP
jgi:uroporphyrinogen-III synthase